LNQFFEGKNGLNYLFIKIKLIKLQITNNHKLKLATVVEGTFDAVRPQEISGYHRKRSSSLPRILPPILDDDDDEQGIVVQEGQRRDQVSQPVAVPEPQTRSQTIAIPQA
jgi:hypothetical protein